MHSEPSNEELGIEPWTGWKLLAAWFGIFVFGFLGLFGVVWLMFEIVGFL